MSKIKEINLFSTKFQRKSIKNDPIVLCFAKTKIFICSISKDKTVNIECESHYVTYDNSILLL